MTRKVLIIGGYGNFGSYIAKRLAEDENIQLFIGGRSLAKATAFCETLDAVNTAQPLYIDITGALQDDLSTLRPDIVIHTSGPFQGQNTFVAEACIKENAHYIDLADGREFVCNIKKLDENAKNHGVLIISGASSVPCLSSALIDNYLPEFRSLETVEYAISTAQKTNRGLATTAGVLSYAGSPFKTLIDGKMQEVYGWQSLHKHKFKELGNRFLGNCDIPDLGLFPGRYPHLKTIRFYAGLEIPFIHIGLWLMTWLRRFRLLPPLNKFAAILLKASFLFDKFGSDTSAFYMKLSGTDDDGKTKTIAFDLTARSGDGPFIPCMPAILLARKLAAGKVQETGAKPCVGMISKDEYLSALKDLDITW